MKGKEFRVIRAKLGIKSQEKLAKMLGVSIGTVWNYENDKVSIPLVVEKYLKSLVSKDNNE